MKHHVAVKFIAIALCAAFLLGALSSTAGALILSRLDLYNHTVDEVLENQQRSECEDFAQQAALRYASIALGNFPEDLSNTYYDHPGFYSDSGYGYTLLDENGSVLESSNTHLKDTATALTLPVGGKYPVMISEAPLQEAPEAPDLQEEYSVLGDEPGVYDAIPDGSSVQIFAIIATISGDGSQGASSIDSLGFLFRDESGNAVFHATSPWILDEAEDGTVLTAISFRDHLGQVVYEARDENGVGWVERSGEGHITFYAGDPAAEDLSALYTARFQFSSGGELEITSDSDSPIGSFYYDPSGYLRLNLTPGRIEGIFPADQMVSELLLLNIRGEALLHYSGPGTLTAEADGSFHYISQDVVVSVPGAEGEDIPIEGSYTVPSPEGPPLPRAIPEETAEAVLPEEAMIPVETMIPAETVISEEPVISVEILPTDAEPAIPAETLVTEPSLPEVTAPTEAPRATLPSSTHSAVYYNHELGQDMEVLYAYEPLPEYTVEVYLTMEGHRYEAAYTLLRIVRDHRNDLFLILGACLLGFAITAVYLCCAAGHKPKSEEIRPGGLNCLPLDLYLVLVLTLIGLLALLADWGLDPLLRMSIQTGCVAAAGLGYVCCLLFVGFCFAIAAQCKTPGNYLLKNSLFGRCILLTVSFVCWCVRYLPDKVVTLVKWLWSTGVKLIGWLWNLARKLWRMVLGWIRRFVQWTGSLLRRFLALLPMTWQWLACGFLLAFLSFLTALVRSPLWVLLGAAAITAVVMYVAHCFGVLQEGARRMSKGDLDTKVDGSHMAGCFQSFAGDLNALADVAVVAAQKQLKSERMKTELITNVSHDIKTPLTSIINYVDLLQKPHTEEEGEAYLEVLQRQSQRLKKLIDDLMDMSKASTGNMNVDITQLDAVEFVNQALGEFSDKLDKAHLTPIFRHSADSAMMLADGRLVWRVLSNLLGNAVKYAMPGTRLYLDLVELEGKVVISLKNISREELNMEAEELMERFVRGDDSRNTEGSGLGLNIAKSLMELQKGQLQLLVDGDLFKVTLIFPGA